MRTSQINCDLEEFGSDFLVSTPVEHDIPRLQSTNRVRTVTQICSPPVAGSGVHGSLTSQSTARAKTTMISIVHWQNFMKVSTIYI